ncbi:MAG: signal recognition particle-docking protein FtsY [Actinomycetota bacterium]
MEPIQIAIVAVVALLLVVALTVVVTRGRGRNAQLPPSEASPYPGDLGAESTTATATLERETVEVPPTLERPEASATRWQRLRARLARSGAVGNALLAVLSRGRLTEEDWEELEETLLLADVGMGPTTELMDTLRREAKVLDTSDPEAVKAVLRRELVALVDPTMGRTLDISPVVGDDGEPHPATVLVVGVNGTGKTTTVGKLARVLVADGHSVVLGAADTFRAAAADQLTTWGQRVGVDVVRADREGADPASVAFDAVREGRERRADVVLIDTAGRLQNKSDLMNELGKIKRVMGRGAPVREVLLVLDATTGQNGMRQAQVFSEVVDVTGIVLTKLDGSAKGGIVIAVQRELGVPVKYVGLGEGPDDLAPFDAEGFVDALLS